MLFRQFVKRKFKWEIRTLKNLPQEDEWQKHDFEDVVRVVTITNSALMNIPV
jgi:hypothetical protein